MENKLLQGKKVKVDSNDIYEGEQKIFVLEDASILDKMGNLIENDTDTFVNEDIQQKFKEEERSFLKLNKNKYAAAAHFDQKTSGQNAKQLLPHYDELKFEKQFITLNEEGNYDITKEQRLDNIRKKLQSKNSQKIENSGKNVIASEYEIKPLFKKKVKKNNNNLLDFLENQAPEEEDLGAHENFKIKGEEGNQLELSQNYQNALEKAKQLQLQAKQRNNFIFEEDDLQQKLEESLEKQRQKQQQNQQQVIDLMRENKEEEINIENSLKVEIENMKILPPKPRKKNQKVEFIGEIRQEDDFLKTIDTEEQQKQKQTRTTVEFSERYSFKDTQQGSQSVVNISLPSERYIGVKRRQEELENQLPDLTAELDDETRQKLKLELQFMEEVQTDMGVGSTLSQLRSKGFLSQDNYDYSGRTLDIKPHRERNDLDGSGEKAGEINLEYRDETGKLMTKKQAFRYACWIFHGQKPGYKKLEKMRKKDLEREQTRQKQMQGTTVLAKALKMQQQSSNQPHLLLNTQKFGE